MISLSWERYVRGLHSHITKTLLSIEDCRWIEWFSAGLRKVRPAISLEIFDKFLLMLVIFPPKSCFRQIR